mmetsp:Transcript_21515/g.39458  ORF Transcript_21515/g.39458 Transcript_21515/m.39458 type:complete len:485 (+) Transcript_21515:41-1495(+)
MTANPSKEQLNVLVYMIGTRGDVMPAVPVCQALEKRGHKTLFVSTPNYRESVEAFGLKFAAACSTNWEWRNEYSYLSEDEVDEMLVTMDPKRFVKICGEKGLPWNLAALIPEAAKGLVKILQTGNFDTIFTNVCGCFSAFRAFKGQQKSNMVFISSNYSPGFQVVSGAYVPVGYTMSKYGWMNRMKQMHFMFTVFLPTVANLPEMKKSTEEVSKVEGVDNRGDFTVMMELGKEPVIGMWSPALFPPQPDYDKNIHVAGVALLPPPPGWISSSTLKAFMEKRDAQGRKPIVVDFGSMPAGSRLLEHLGSILVKLGYNVCLQVGTSKDEPVRTDFGVLGSREGSADATQPDRIFRTSYVDHAWLFPRACAVICHGGAGTLQRCLMSGIPIVVCPMVACLIADQRWHGTYLEKEGLGVLIAGLHPSEDEVKAAMDKALSCTDACAAMAEKMKSEEDGAEVIAQKIEKITFEKREGKLEKKGCLGFMG